ncbi:natural product biosynthesis luciferase-like monooxygenase domain-containing protein [Hyphomicrobium facile]|uniref:Natural product biosynthesis luciferase-like monooxygenase domain-containing protein n=2 Tax=Hyphomicrobium facile TaxID=51670 RepID=A0A1I7NFC9_9HYPH|nr:natural product biosynthesis luciferase-like monooxygenase domain-containing protein [Hyphomicrobium facile]
MLIQQFEIARMLSEAGTMVEDLYPLSPLQQGMLFHHLEAQIPGVDVEQLEVEINEPIDANLLARAWAIVAAQHSILRTRFSWKDLRNPIQEVLSEVKVPLVVRDLSALSSDDQVAALSAFLTEDRLTALPLDVAPLWRVTLFHLGADRHQLVFTYSHAILDSCFAFVVQDVFDTYATLKRGDQPSFSNRPPYRDFIAWLGEHLASSADAAETFWRTALAGFQTPTNLEALRLSGGPARTSGPHATLEFALSPAHTAKLHALCDKAGLRTSTVVEAAWALVLSAFSGRDDVAFGATRTCRRSSIKDADRIVGLFINTLPVRVKLDGDLSALEFCQQLRRNQVETRAFEHSPLPDVLRHSELPRSQTLFDTIVVFNAETNDARFKSFGPEWQHRHFKLHDQTNFAFNVMAYDGPQITFKLSYDTGCFSRSAADRIGDMLQVVLDAIADNPDAKIVNLPRLPSQDARLVLETWNATEKPLPGPGCIHEAFEAQADRTPDVVALVDGDRAITYRELDKRANQLAHEILAQGVKPDQMVGIFIERSIEMVVGLLGILKAGAAYVPMDPAYPSERLAIILEDTQARIVVTTSDLRTKLPAGLNVICADPTGQNGNGERPRVAVTGNNLAYVIFTSGSTGRPKGVMLEHRNVTSFFTGMDEALGTAPGVWLATTSISFDISVLELFWTLARGFKVVIQKEAEREARAAQQRASATPIDFSLFYFAADSDDAAGKASGRYRLLLEGAKFADENGFSAIWTPERHFHPFGGLYPNPAVTGAAVAAVTKRVAIRAGSVVLPLHSPFRIAEEWSIVDNLSNGRVGLSFASGWHVRDFALQPQNYKNRRELFARGIETVKALWRGEAVETIDGDGQTVQLKTFPPPVQKEPKLWVTASSHPDTFALAGRMGANVLTNLLVMKPEQFIENVAVYRKAWADAGHEGRGSVSLMLHTFVGADEEEVRRTVRGPFIEYLKTSTDLVAKMRWELTPFAKRDDRDASDPRMALSDLQPEELDAIMEHAFARYFETAGLFGTPASCVAKIEKLKAYGVDEIACLIDFGISTEDVLANLPNLDELRRMANPGDDELNQDIPSQITRHSVTHLQATPSLASILASDDASLNALGHLRMLLLGGEALPGVLIDRLRSRYQGPIHNMYGPTETCIWSTTAKVGGAGDPITIGGPIANTRVYVVDQSMRPLPIGVPGEIVIGGAGVARGYLGRPELTEERFVPDPFGRGDERLYRTGDLGRWLHNGTIEYLGRLDQQVKIRGHRIEPGEIESVLSRHPSVKQSAVVSRSDEGSGEQRLIAYVVPAANGSRASAAPSTAHWETIWDETYRGTGDAVSETVGWRSSYTGEQIPDAEMQDWIERTVERVRDLRPRRILEIGCGTGMILLRVAPNCDRYHGIDLSAAALARVRNEADQKGLGNVVLEQRAANTLASMDGGPFDTIIINSVAQYFPNVDYFVDVLTQCVEKLAPGGAIFVGDVRSRALLEVMLAEIELLKASPETQADELRARLRKRVDDEAELVLDPELFQALPKFMPSVEGVEVELKTGRAQTEMTRFRYDVVIRKQGGISLSPVATTTVQAPQLCTIEALGDILRSAQSPIRVTGIPNARVASAVAALDALNALPPSARLGSLAGHATDSRLQTEGIDPEDVRSLAENGDVAIEWSAAGREFFDAVYRPRVPGVTRATETGVIGVANTDDSASPDWSQYANRPVLRAAGEDSLMPALRQHLRKALPEYMLPSAFVLLDALPLTPNGKLDRQALPAPDRARHETATAFVAPATDVERELASIFQDVLGLAEVGLDDNFFDLGASSLTMVSVVEKIRTRMGTKVSLVRLFQFPTLRSLAASFANRERDAASVAPEQNRASFRRDLMQRRREARAR